jgi:hypothetical protein
MKKILAGLAAAAAMSAAAFALDFGPAPANYESAAEDYISSRLVEARGVRLQFTGGPYKVYADVSGYEALPCWAVDVRVKGRLPTGAIGGYVPYTVLFLDGRPIAFKEDARRISRL